MHYASLNRCRCSVLILVVLTRKKSIASIVYVCLYRFTFQSPQVCILLIVLILVHFADSSWSLYMKAMPWSLTPGLLALQGC